MKKIFYLLLALWAWAGQLAAQVPEAFHYQAVVRNQAGDLLKAQPLDVRISILEDAPTGTPVYQETHTTTTSDAATIALQVGRGTPTLGTFAEINWGSGKAYFIRTQFTLNGEEIDLGATQLLSVPYALYARQSGEKHDLVLEGETLRIKGGGAGVVLPTTVVGGDTGGTGSGSCLWMREDIATATYPGSMALKNPSGNQYLKAYSDLDDAGHLRLNLAGKSSIEFDPGIIRMFGNDNQENIQLLANNTGILQLYNHAYGASSYLDAEQFYLKQGENKAVEIQKLGISGGGYLFILNGKGKKNVTLSAAAASNGNTGWIGIHDVDGNDMVRITSLTSDGKAYNYNPSIYLYSHNELKGQFYVNPEGRSVLTTDLLYVDGYQLYSAPVNYAETSTRTASYAPCYVSENAGQISFRGTATLEGGTRRVVLPPKAARKIAEGTATIQLTPLSADSKGLAVVEKADGAFTVAELQSGTGNYAFDWTLTALCQREPQLRSGSANGSAAAIGTQAAFPAH